MHILSIIFVVIILNSTLSCRIAAQRLIYEFFIISPVNIPIDELYDTLFSHFGETGWWPADTADEVLIGAVLTQNTSWNNVEISLNKLKGNGIEGLNGLSTLEEDELSILIRSSGFYRQKSRTLINVSKSILETYGSLGGMRDRKTSELQSFLFSMKGIGQETMDCILLYALDKPEFVVDKYTLRIFQRVGVDNSSNIRGVKQIVEKELSGNLGKLRNLHGMLVELAKNYCKVRPSCQVCPLREKCDYATGLA